MRNICNEKKKSLLKNNKTLTDVCISSLKYKLYTCIGININAYYYNDNFNLLTNINELHKIAGSLATGHN